MKRIFSTALVYLFASTTIFADDNQALDIESVEETVRKALPNTQITTIQAAPIDGLVEIVAGKNVLYSDPTGRYLVVGSIYDMHTAIDLTAERKAQASAINWESLPIKTSVKYGGSGSQKLAVFFDPECGWCRKLHKQLASLDDVEVYAIMYPVDGLTPTSKGKAATILCSADPLKALDTVMAGEALPPVSDQACLNDANTAISQVQAFARDNNINGTPTLVAPDGRVRPGFMDEEHLRAWLKKSS